MVVDYTVAGDVFQPGKPRPWANSQPDYRGGGNPVFDITPDGKRLVIPGDFNRTVRPTGNVHLTFLVHWFDELRRRVPDSR
jgi:hypothetical protein